MMQETWEQIVTHLDDLVLQPNALRSIVILVISLILAYLLSNIVARGMIRVAQLVAVKSDNAPTEQTALRLRRVETYLSVTVAMVRVLFVAIVGYIAWLTLSPSAYNNTGVAAIGASAFFIVLASATIGPLLRDITAGSTMIVERWFNVGDHVRVEPFIELGGVVERVTLRSTKLRSLNGEVIWLHNQHMQGVRVAPRGVRTIAVDVLVRDLDKANKIIQDAVDTIPVGRNMLSRKLVVMKPEKLGDNFWRITIVGETPPGREWVVEKFFVDAIVEIDGKNDIDSKVIIHQPIVRYTDPAAEREFNRAARVRKSS